MKNIAEAVVKNVLSILFSKKSLLPEEQRLFGVLCRELGLGREDYARLNAEWRARPGELLRGADAEEDRSILSFMVAGAYFDNMVYSGERECLFRFAAMAGADAAALERFLGYKWTFDFPDGVLDDMLEIKARLAAGGGPAPGETAPPPVTAPRKEDAGSLSGYVATQVGEEGIDELQSLFMCAQLGLNAALSGPPGIGKTESVLELARILELPLFTKTCSSRTTESHIISHPVLIERNGVSVTAHEDGALCRAMLGPGLFYGDEYNLLKEDVQKRMNSAFDDRRSIDRNDGSSVKAKPGFMAVISYNPSPAFGRRDLEDSVADRFVHFRFADWPADLRAYVSAMKADREVRPSHADFKIVLETRGISREGGFAVLSPAAGGGEAWFDFFTRKPVKAPTFRYQCVAGRQPGAEARAQLAALDKSALPYVALARAWSQYLSDVNQFAESGRSWLLDEMGLGDSSKPEDFESLVVHRASTRIVTASLAHHRWLTARGAGPYLAQAYGTRLIINQMSYGAFGSYKLRDMDTVQVLEGAARVFRLFLTNTVYNTGVDPSPRAAGKAGAPAGSAPRPGASSGPAAGTPRKGRSG